MLAVRIALTLAVCLFRSAPMPAQQSAREPLFDGRTLDGWDGDPAVWSVQDGCIQGSTVGAPIEHNTFLIWRGTDLTDFELSFAVRLEGDNNSGVQYRSRRLAEPAFAVGGYQCDVHPEPGYFGMLYEERGRGIVATRGQKVACGADGSARVLASSEPGAVDLGQWHAMKIIARGHTVQHWVDGRLAVEVIDDARAAPRSGCVALQLHAGPPMRVWFKDLVAVRLPTEEAAAVAAQPAATGPEPQWIWDRAPHDGEEVFFRRVFALPAAVRSAQLVFTCDNHCRVYLNGDRIGQSDQWEAPRTVAVGKQLCPGDNVLAVHGWNDGGPAGLVLQLTWTAGDTHGTVVSDAEWACSDDDPDGWDQVGFDAAGWAAATVVAPLGAGPWAAVLAADAFAGFEFDDAPQPPRPAPELTVKDRWHKERLLAVPRAFGSWVCLARDPQGRLYASDQTRGLYRILPAGVGGRTDTAIERIDVDLDGCQGLCWAHGALYAVANGAHSGLYRVTDSDGDDRPDRAQLLRPLDGRGEHGPHAVVLAPDGEHLLVLCGNHTRLPDLAGSRVPRTWGEDGLLPRFDDPNGHAVGIRAPGGFVCQVDRDGQDWELYCCGFRNAYDLAVVANGDILTYDADMEWDMGLPWYRPTRVLQVVSGADYGWRSGSGKWPADYPDTLPSIADVGPGSPTGVVAGDRGALVLDWTFGIVHEVDLWPDGGSFKGSVHAYASGQPLPATDIVAGAGTGYRTPWSGSCSPYYLLTGGRGVASSLYRVAPAGDGGWARADGPIPRRDERVALEAFHGRVDERAVRAAWPYLGDEDPFLRHAARIAIESQPVATWRQPVLAETSSAWSVLSGLLALARQGEAADLEPLLRALGCLDFAALEPLQRIAWLRVHELALLRLGPLAPGQQAALRERLSRRFPCGDQRADQELCALLAHLDAPGLLDQAVPLLAEMQPAPPPPWAEVAARNANYGGAIAAMLQAMPPTTQIGIANALRTVRAGWTLEQRRQYFAFLAAARTRRGGASYDGYLGAIVDAAWATCSVAEQAELAEVIGRASAEPEPFVATPPKGPGRNWQLADAAAIAKAKLDGRRADLAAGHNLFFAAGCASCHRFCGEGRGVGPDLTSLGNKFAAADVLEAILEPSKVVSDQFAGAVLTRTDGTTLFGRVSKRDEGGELVYEVVTATAEASIVRVAGSDVRSVEPATLSPMPAGLVDRLGEGELLDLLSFLLSRGERPDGAPGDGGARR